MSGSGDGDSNVAFQPATYLGVWMCPFFGKEGGHAFHEHIGFPAIKAISGKCKWGEMFALFETSRHILMFFCLLLLLQYDCRIAIVVCFCIQVGDDNIQDTFCLALLQALD